jgi:hypothetical protein
MPTPAVKRRLRGKAEPRAAALAAYEKARAPLTDGQDERRAIALAPYTAPAPEDMFRWRVELDCGCIHELLTLGDDKAPDEHQWRDDRHFNLLPAGQLMCWHEDEPRSVPYRAITEWGDVRHVARWAMWDVTLACGHTGEVTVEDLSWTPSDGPVRRDVSAEELARENARLDADLLDGADANAHRVEMVEHARRWWSDGCPEPGTEALCHSCDEARQIVAYEQVGWLVTRPTAEARRTVQTRAAVVQRLREAEREATRLREQLAALDADEASTPAT